MVTLLPSLIAALLDPHSRGANRGANAHGHRRTPTNTEGPKSRLNSTIPDVRLPKWSRAAAVVAKPLRRLWPPSWSESLICGRREGSWGESGLRVPV